MKQEENLSLSPRPQREKDALRKLAILEDLAEKKATVYARLLTDAHLAEQFENIAKGHAERKSLLTKLALEVAEG